MDKIVKILFFLSSMLLANEVKCIMEQERVYCTYFIDRSDNENGKVVVFHWQSPLGNDDRVRIFNIPPYHGSVYDYRYLPGREKGEWIVVVKELDSNKSVKTSFVIENNDEEFFEE
ncbi:MAG TPA: hypothetical protein EYP79_00570 [Campylobacterales bacterium]|nr:hypothetical protein [Campylobacterales bacterium]